jgi:hypothetical protein
MLIKLFKMIERIIKWFFFSTTIGVTPIVFAWAKNYAFGLDSDLINLTSRGQLLIITVGMAGATFGELVSWKTANKVLQLLLCGITIFIFSWSQYLYVVIATENGMSPDPANIFNMSAWTYCSCMVISIVSIVAVAINNSKTIVGS